MEKKRSAGVTILGSFTIFMSIVYSLFVNHLNASNGVVDLICLAVFICGVGFLRLANWARIAVILFVACLIVLTVAMTIYYVIDEYIHTGIFYDGFSMIVFIAGIIFFLGGVIFYLTRPKVKEQFK